jgi:HSP20 family protein
MSRFDRLQRGMERTLGFFAEGWRHLQERAGQALTLFRPASQDREGQLETAAERDVLAGPRFALLAADVREDEAQVRVRLELPGLAPENLDLAVDEDSLVVRGEKHMEREHSSGHWHLRERAYGCFERRIPLPCPVEEEGSAATYRQGVLEVTLPKSARLRTRRIPVEPG